MADTITDPTKMVDHALSKFGDGDVGFLWMQLTVTYLELTGSGKVEEARKVFRWMQALSSLFTDEETLAVMADVRAQFSLTDNRDEWMASRTAERAAHATSAESVEVKNTSLYLESFRR